MRHVTAVHAGTLLTEDARTSFQEFGRGACSAEGCGAMRAFGSRNCGRCKSSAPITALRDGDRVVGTANQARRARLEQIAEQMEPNMSSQETTRSAVPAQTEIVLPLDWKDRVDKLPSSTTLHYPVVTRHRAVEVATWTLIGALAGSENVQCPSS